MASQIRIAGILLFAGVLGAQTEWPFYGRDAAGQRLSDAGEDQCEECFEAEARVEVRDRSGRRESGSGDAVCVVNGSRADYGRR